MSPYLIRPADTMDGPPIAEIERACRRPLDADRIQRAIDRGPSRWAVAEHGGRVVGYVRYRLGALVLRLDGLAVSPRRRRRKVGTALVDWLRADLIGHRRVIAAACDEDNLPAQLFLKSCGFRWVQTMPGQGDEGDVYRFECRMPARVVVMDCGDVP